MDANFWHQLWVTNQIGFHERAINPLLLTYFKELALNKGRRIFVPLCGKTLDIGWLLAQGYRVAGAELSELAVQDLFAELGLDPEIRDMGRIKHYSATDIDLFAGDIFDLTYELLGPVDAIFDRAALVALPEPVRVLYARHITAITENAPQLLITYDYDQNMLQGPPFSISYEEVKRHYGDQYTISSLACLDTSIRGQSGAKETVWLLK